MSFDNDDAFISSVCTRQHCADIFMFGDTANSTVEGEVKREEAVFICIPILLKLLMNPCTGRSDPESRREGIRTRIPVFKSGEPDDIRFESVGRYVIHDP